MEYVEFEQLFQDTTSGYRKGHSTTTVLLRIRDDIIEAMKKGELTLTALADFSKAFDTVDYSIVNRKLHAIGLSKSALLWIFSYLSNRQQFVQVNDKQSRLQDVLFGVPQGSVLGPVIFNLYARDMQDCLKDGSTCFQYADDTTVLLHAPPRDLKDCVNRMNNTLQSIESWAADSNLLLNETKTKQMLVTTRQMSRVHDLGDYTPPLSLKNKIVDRVDRFRLLGTLLSQDLKWTELVNVTSPCFGVLAVLRKIKNMTPQETKKSLVQSLVLSKLNFNDTVTYPLPMFLQKRMQRVQNAAAGFVLNRYCSKEDVLNLGWLPTLENTQLNILKLGHRALYNNNNWPEYLTLSRHNPSRTLRSSSTLLLQISLLKGTFQKTPLQTCTMIYQPA